MEYPPPNHISEIFNDINQDSKVETVLKFDESELLQYVKKSGDTMQGAIRVPEVILYGESSKITFQDGSTLSTTTDAANNSQKLTAISYNEGTTTTTIANNTHINNLTAGNINTSHLSGTTNNLQTQINSTVNNTSTNTSDISALQTLTSQHSDDISQNAADIVTINDNISTIETNVSTNTSDISSLTSIVNTNTSNIATNTSAISAIQSVNTTQTNDINAIKAKTNKLVVTPYNDLDIITTGTCNLQIGTVKDDIGTDDGTNRISIGVYEGNNVADASGNPNYAIPQNTAGIFGKMYSDFIVASRGNQNHEGLILSGCAYNSGGQTDQGSHIFINKQGLVSIGPNCRTKYSEGFKLNIEGTTKLDGNVTIPSGRTINNISTTTLSYLDATSSIQTQLNNRLLLSGGTMSGALNMGSNNIINVNNIQLSTINGSPYIGSALSGDLNPRFKATSNNGSTSYEIEEGQYIKIGSTVHYTIDVKLSSKSSMSGDLYVECPEFASFPMIVSPVLNRYPVNVGFHSGFSDSKINSLTAYMDTSHKIFFWVSTFTPGSNSFSFGHLSQGNIDGSFRVTLQGYFYTTV